MKRFFAILAALLLTGCTPQIAVPTEPAPQQSAQPATVTDVTRLFTDRDYETDYEKAATITLSNGGITCDSDAVQISGSTVTITDEGTYVLTGKLTDGQVVVRADKTDKTQLVLENAGIHNSTAAPIYIEQADKVFVTLAGENTLTADSLDETVDAVLFSKEDLTLNGSGSLTIASPTHGIVSKDALTVTGGTFDITCASHGIAGKDNLCIDGGSFAIATDMGCVTDEVLSGLVGADTVLIESNHDVNMLCDGPYPVYLKRRILSNRGHLSNADCARLACHLAHNGTRRIILGHLSKENNRPGLAMAENGQALMDCGVELYCAPVFGCLELETREGELCLP